ncbi:uncharacterized protein LOC121423273 [Lytechinus variegatus]|uniref:uncharacterized protein LOC121423273 n=1 Tax=Lytechinus variegatus TaxID=7654 RepID=UPI001BB1432E|nr:uncharacterized protein LOC121423273 [Lytechinus variegatus]
MPKLGLFDLRLVVVISIGLATIASAQVDNCLGKCDAHPTYYCDAFTGVCNPCHSANDSPKCKGLFRPSKTTTEEALKTRSERERVTVNPIRSIRPRPDSKVDINDPGEHRQNNIDIDLPDPSRKEENHTNILIIVASVTVVTLGVGVVIGMHRRSRTPTA